MEELEDTSAHGMMIATAKISNNKENTHGAKANRMSYQKAVASSTQQRRISQSKTSGIKKADWQLALKNTELKRNRNYKGREMGMCTGVEHFRVYGPGVSLFFYFLRYLMVAFLAMALVALGPSIYNYLKGTVLSSQATSLSYYFAGTTIGNISSSASSYSTADKYVNVICDMVVVFVFIVFYFFWLKRGGSLTVQIRSLIKLKCYCVLQLTEFAQGVTQGQVATFMRQFGGVLEVAPVRDYDETISLSKKIYELEVELKMLEIRKEEERSVEYDEEIKEKKEKIDEVYKELVLYQDDNKQDMIKFFVTFASVEERETALRELEKHKRKFCECCEERTPENFLLRGEKVTVKACHNQPGEIIWQNQHVTWSTRWIRVVIQYLLLLAVVAIGFFAISFVNILTPSSTTSVDTSSYTSTTILSVTDTKIVQNWCIDNKVSVLETGSSSTIYNFCWTYISSYFLKILITVGISVCVVVIKFIFKKFVVFLAKLKRYKTQSEQSKDMVQNLFIVYTATTVLITFLLQALVLGISFKQLVTSLISNSYLQTNASSLQQYSDFVSDWYLEIGYQIAFNCLVMALHPALTMPIAHYLGEAWTMWRAQGEEIQANMQKAMQPQQFEIQSNYADILVIIFVGLAFSGGMPVLIVISFFVVFFRYFYFKHLFFSYCKIPKTFDEALDLQVSSLLPYAIIIHFCFSIWMFGVSSIFPLDTTVSINLGTSNIMQSVSFITLRMLGTWYYSAFFIVFLVIWVLKTFVYNLISSLCFEEEESRMIIPVKIDPSEVTGDIFAASVLSSKTLCQSYKIENNPDYVEVLEIMKRKRKFIVKVKDFTDEG